MTRKLAVGWLAVGSWWAGMDALGRPLCSVTPESQGVSSRGVLGWIEACETAAATNGLRGGYLHGFVILRHGKTIAEGTWAPQDTLNETHMLYSHSKSFTSAAIGLLADDGKLDFDERLVDIFPDKIPAQPSEHLRQLRVRDLLTMNSGVNYPDNERRDIKGDWVRGNLTNDYPRLPGTGFLYDSGATHLLAAIVERKTGRRLMDFLGERLFAPLEMKSPWSNVSPTGVACGGWGMNMTTRDMATFGQLLLQKGNWNGRQIISSEWVTLATARQTWSGKVTNAQAARESASDWMQGYGFQFWRCRHGAFRADGASGQLTVVMPGQDAVISVHAGLGNMQYELDLIWDYLLPAFKNGVLAEDAEGQAKLTAKCATLALPLEDPRAKAFLDLDKCTAKRGTNGWEIAKGNQTLRVGEGKWLVTPWHFTDDAVEALFAWCGTLRIAANGKRDGAGKLRVTWQMLGGIDHGSFTVPINP